MSFDKILRCHQGINALAQSLIERPAFDEIYIHLPDPASPELGFIRATSWLYCLYFETGRISLNFLRRLGVAYTLINREDTDHHVEVVRCLRTEMHHNLGFTDSDLTTRTTADSWRRKACGTALPKTPEQWNNCYIKIIDESNTFLGSIDKVIRQIESDGEDARQHIEKWLRNLSKNWTTSAFDTLIDDAKCYFAMNALNIVKFRNRHIDRWRKSLESFDDDFDFKLEASRLIEKSLLGEDGFVLPITGNDLIEHLGVKRGPVIGELLKEARRHFEVHRCSRDELLAHIHRYNDHHKVTV